MQVLLEPVHLLLLPPSVTSCITCVYGGVRGVGKHMCAHLRCIFFFFIFFFVFDYRFAKILNYYTIICAIFAIYYLSGTVAMWSAVT